MALQSLTRDWRRFHDAESDIERPNATVHCFDDIRDILHVAFSENDFACIEESFRYLVHCCYYCIMAKWGRMTSTELNAFRAANCKSPFKNPFTRRRVGIPHGACTPALPELEPLFPNAA